MIKIDESALKEEIYGALLTYLKESPEMGKDFAEKVLTEACPTITALLKSGKLLPSRQGRKMFYDTESPIMRDLRGLPPREDPVHLMDQWFCDFTIESDMKAVIHVKNSKMVAGRRKYWMLVDLLWEGTQTYIADTALTFEQLRHLSEEEIKHFYKYRTINQIPGFGPFVRKGVKAVNKRGEKIGGRVSTRKVENAPTRQDVAEFRHNYPGIDLQPDYVPKRMNYYNRYAGRFFFNQTMRRGIDEDVVKSFKEYVMNCVNKGLELAIGEVIAS